MTAVTKIRVRYAETDQMGVVYYGNYFVWMEVGRTDILHKFGLSYREMEKEGVMTPIAKAGARYYTPCFYDDLVEVHTTVTKLTSVRVRFDFKIMRGTDLICTGFTEHAFIDTNTRKLTRLPKEWIEKIRLPENPEEFINHVE